MCIFAAATEAERIACQPNIIGKGRVEDKGVGFQNHRSGGMGLVNMRERAEIIGGRIEFLPGEHGCWIYLFATT